MNILVFVNQVPDTDDVKLDPRTGNLMRDGVQSLSLIHILYAEIKAMEFLAYDAAATKDAGKRCTLDAAAAKLFATEHAVQICIQAQQVFGGNGYSKEYDVERLIRDARGWCVMEGSTEILRMIVSGTVLA